MSISRLRWHAILALGAAATAVLALAVPAGASTGTTEISPEQAGYTATGAQLKVIGAQVWLRQTSDYDVEVAHFGHSVQLWSSGLVVTLGVTSTTSQSDAPYFAHATIYDRRTHAVIASNPNAQFCGPDGSCHPDPGASFFAFAPMTLQISYNPGTGLLYMIEYQGLVGYTFISSYTVAGQSFTQARVGTEFGSSPWDGSYSYAPPASYVKVARYTDVHLTTYSGHTSTLWSWWVHHKLLANTGQQSGSDWVAVPTGLSDGGASFSTWFVPQSAQSSIQPSAP
jgi:hypothetical protein